MTTRGCAFLKRTQSVDDGVGSPFDFHVPRLWCGERGAGRQGKQRERNFILTDHGRFPAGKRGLLACHPDIDDQVAGED